MIRHIRQRSTIPTARTSQAGTTLLESLIASALLLFIAVSLFPLFYRASANNLSGADSNRATQHNRSKLESLLALPFDSPVFNMRNALPDHLVQSDGTGDKMTLAIRYWDQEANSVPTGPHDPTHHIASPAWLIDPTQARGLVLWSRTSEIRHYSYADIADGVIDVNDPNQLATQGHPQLFDAPLSRDALDSQINFQQEEVAVTSLRPGVPEFRAQLMRTY